MALSVSNFFTFYSLANLQGQIIMKGTTAPHANAISGAANVFAARLGRHRPAVCEFSRGRFDVWSCILVIIYNMGALSDQRILLHILYVIKFSSNFAKTEQFCRKVLPAPLIRTCITKAFISA